MQRAEEDSLCEEKYYLNNLHKKHGGIANSVDFLCLWFALLFGFRNTGICLLFKYALEIEEIVVYNLGID